MKYVNNEKGMALLTVILMFTVFTILGLVVFNAISNNSKQITKTEENIQATDIAEMGVTFYKTAIQEKVRALNEIGAANINNYMDSLNISLGTIPLRKIISEDDVYFDLQPIDISEYGITESNELVNNINSYKNTTNTKIGIILKSKGYANGEIRYLSLHLIYDIRIDPEGIFTINIPEDEDLSITCGSTLSTQSYANFNCVYQGDQSIETLDSISDSTIYISGDLDVSDKINSISGGEIHVEGDLSIDNVLNNVRKTSRIEVEGSADINKIDTTNQTINIVIGRNLYVNYLQNLKDSTIEVYGNAEFGNFPNPSDSDISNIQSTTIKIYGNASLPNNLFNFQSPSKICVFGELLTGVNNDFVYLKNEAGFENACGNPNAVRASYILRPTPEEIIDYH
jgi:hypothetical protein